MLQSKFAREIFFCFISPKLLGQRICGGHEEANFYEPLDIESGGSEHVQSLELLVLQSRLRVITKLNKIWAYLWLLSFLLLRMNILKAEGIRCIILTSGTLAPLAPLITELELNVKVCLENPHIVKHDQICVNIIPRGPDGEPLTSTFRNR